MHWAGVVAWRWGWRRLYLRLGFYSWRQEDLHWFPWSQVLGGIGAKLLQAARIAEVIRFAAIFELSGSLLRLNFHVANGVFGHRVSGSAIPSGRILEPQL